MELYTVTVPAAQEPITLAEVKAFMKVTSTAEDALINALISAATDTLEKYANRYFVTRTVQGDFSTVMVSKTEIYPWVKLRRAELQTVTSVQVIIDSTYTDESYQIKKHTHGFSRILFDDFTNALDDTPYPLRIVFTAGFTTSGSITAFADNGSGGTTVTSAGHGLSNGVSVTISDTTSYDGTYYITGVTTDTFDISTAFVADDATGEWLSGVPDDIKQALMMYVNFLYRNRGDCIDANACGVLAENSGLPPVVRAIMARYRIIEVFA